LTEVFSTKFNLSNMLLSVEVFANVHNSIKIATFTVDFYCFLMFTCLNIKFCCFLPVITVTLKLSLLD